MPTPLSPDELYDFLKDRSPEDLSQIKDRLLRHLYNPGAFPKNVFSRRLWYKHAAGCTVRLQGHVYVVPEWSYTTQTYFEVLRSVEGDAIRQGSLVAHAIELSREIAVGKHIERLMCHKTTPHRLQVAFTMVPGYTVERMTLAELDTLPIIWPPRSGPIPAGRIP